MTRVLGWIRAHDAGLSALRRSARAAIVMPALFAIATQWLHNPTFAVFAAFCSMSTLLFVDFTGSMRERLTAHVSLVLGGAVLVSLGTLCSRTAWLAVPASLAVGFAVLFIGVVSSVLATSSTALLVGFVLGVTTPGPVGSLSDRLAGWLVAGAVGLVAIAVLWPAPTREPLRMAAARACAALARRLRSEVDCARGGFTADQRAGRDDLVREASAAVAALRTSFFATPYRPTGLTTAARTLVRLVDQVIWLDAVLEGTPADHRSEPADPAVYEVKLAAAALLERGANLLEAGEAGPGELAELEADLGRVEQARAAMEQTVTTALPVRRTSTAEFVSSLEPSFRAQEMSFVIAAMAANIELVVAARGRAWWQHILGREPEGIGASLAAPLSSAQERAGAHVERHSVWLHNSLRGAIALAMAVLVSQLTGVQHSFWVVLGTLAVLRSSALNTGQNALRGLAGNVVGFIVGGALVVLLGHSTTAFWVLLPLVVFGAGLAPAAVSFAAGQAAFTITLLVLYNIISPAGWKIGLVRIEDVAIGGAVSLAVGALFWPRGAGSALGQALAESFADSARYLRSAVEYGLTRCDARVPAAPPPQAENRRAAAAARRLDDAFRGYLDERGTKLVSLPDVTALITAVAVLRLTADAVVDLWGRDGTSAVGDRTAARAEILDTGARLVDWYERTARALAGPGAGHAPLPDGDGAGGPYGVPDRLPHDKTADARLIDAVRRDLNGGDGHGTVTAVRMIWTADHLDALRRSQAAVREPAEAAAAAMAAHAHPVRGLVGRWPARRSVPAEVRE
ncbi:MAG: FUSC family protein [Mycobacteriales bacterium]